MTTPNTGKIVQPYLFFGGRCEEAIEFYQKAIGAEVEMLMRFKENPESESCQSGQFPEAWGEKVMHASFRVGESTLMASDGCGDSSGFEGFALSISASNEDEADRLFSALSEGGEITMPLAKTFWSPRFGMLEDRFGIGWMIGVNP